MGKRFNKEFKTEAVRLASEPGNTQSKIERDLGISQGILTRWKRELRKDGDQAFPGKGGLKSDNYAMRRLKRENERLRRERDILKKAVAIFSEDPSNYPDSQTGSALFGVLRRCAGQKVLKKHKFVQSMSRKGDCWDNAVAKSFGIIKSELIHHERFIGPQDTLRAIFEYIEIYYNRKRKHSTLGYKTPAQFEQAGVKAFGFHAIRHLSASLLFKLGYELAVIQSILRHRSPNTTERYLRSIGLEGVREALEDLKPVTGRIIDFEASKNDGTRRQK